MAKLTFGSRLILTSKGLRFAEEGRLAVAMVLELELGFAGKGLEARLQLGAAVKPMLLALFITQHLAM